MVLVKKIWRKLVKIINDRVLEQIFIDDYRDNNNNNNYNNNNLNFQFYSTIY